MRRIQTKRYLKREIHSSDLIILSYLGFKRSAFKNLINENFSKTSIGTKRILQRQTLKTLHHRWMNYIEPDTV